MNQRRKQLFAAIATSGMLALPSLGWGQEAVGPHYLVKWSQPAQRVNLAFVNQTAEDEETTRWIGVQVGELPPLLKKHLKLDHGVLAEGVLPDAPAAKAGVEQDDVLLTIEGKKITRPEDVREAVDAAEEGKSLELTLLHDGKETTVKVVPERRPVDRVIINPLNPATGQQDQVLLNTLARALAEHQAAGMTLVRPGIVVTAKPIELPKDVSVNITHRNGKKSITVIRDKEQWEVTEDSLDKLPEELRAPVAAIVQGPMELGFKLRANAPSVTTEGVRIDPVPPKVHVLKTKERDDARLEAVLKELKTMRKQLDELQRAVQDSK